MKHIVAAAFVAGLATSSWAEGKAHYVAIHVDENDPQVMNMALNNGVNVSEDCESVVRLIELQENGYAYVRPRAGAGGGTRNRRVLA